MRFLATLFGGGGVLVAALLAYAGYLEWDVKRWDAKIDTLCAANGGKDVATRVYETAVAPETAEYFAETKPARTFKIPERREGQTLGSGYPYVVETRVVQVLNENNPGVVKYTSRVVRVADGKTLSERFGYQRSGGGVPLWDPDEIRNCPKVTTKNRLDIRTFRNHPSYVQSED